MSVFTATAVFARQRALARGVVRNVLAPLSTATLRPRQIWEIMGDNRWRFITCQRGEIWITQEGDPRDYVLMEGDMFLITLPGLILVQALEAASVELSPSLKNAPYRGGQIYFA
jgi:hypothetical protein